MSAEIKKTSSGPGRRSEKSEKSSSRSDKWFTNSTKSGERALEVIVLILLLFIILRGFTLSTGDFFKKFTSPFSSPNSFESIDTPIGGNISLSESSEVFAFPGGPSLGTQPAGAKGVVAGGPEFFNGERYWFVDFESGPDGWVPESVLQGANGGAFFPGDTPVGTEVTLTGPTGTQVFSEPGGSSIGTQPDGAKGTITKGPIYANGEKYWYVDYESGPDGWVSESSLTGSDGRALPAGNTPIGNDITTGQGTSVLGSPGGTSIGVQPAGAKGVVTQGPEYVNGQKYWYVDFESGPDGWVPESVLRGASGGAFNPGDSPVGSEIQSTAGTQVRSTPGGKVVGTQPAGAKGVVTKGPEFVNGERYWYVDYESGPDGWVSESSLRNKNGGAFNPGSSLVGLATLSKGGIPILDSPGGKVVGTQPKTAKGVVTKGPEFMNGERYWFVDFESGPDGWVAEKYLLKGDGSPFDAGSTPVGRRVTVIADPANVRETPGGVRIGSQEKGASGVITKGPMYANGERYWYVDFDSGPDGWVAERELMLERAPSLFSKIISRIVGVFKMTSTLLSLLFLTGIIYSVIRFNQVLMVERGKERQKENPEYAMSAAQNHVNRRWEKVLAHVQSDIPADWRLAILEADIMLAELLERMGYAGENVGEKLKRIEQSDFNTIDDAWEAHKVRNLIAHQGSDYVLSKREAQRVIGLYSNVFREFRYI